MSDMTWRWGLFAVAAVIVLAVHEYTSEPSAHVHIARYLECAAVMAASWALFSAIERRKP